MPTASKDSRASIDRFEIVRKLGSGAMGSVFEAHDPKLDRRVALKLLHADTDPEHRDSKRLLREARALARISHPNVVEIYDVGTDGDRVWLAMELVEGRTLKGWALANPPGSKAQRDAALELLRQAAAGLSAAHAVSMTHRDFKPANVLVGDDGRVRVVDFGLARVTAQDDEKLGRSLPDESSAGLQAPEDAVTRTGAVVGTPRYMAPEQHRGEAVDARSDQFAFAVTAWELLHGKPPFEAKTVASIYDAIISRRFNDHREDAVPGWMTRVLRRGLASRPRDRFRSIAGLMRALEGRTRRLRALLAGGATLVLAAGLALRPTETHEGPSCAEVAGARFDRVWTPTLDQQLHDAIDRTRVPFARNAQDSLRTNVARFRDGWVQTVVDVCDGETTAPLASLSCLERDLDTLEKLLESLLELSRKDAERIASTLRRLPPAERCKTPASSGWASVMPSEAETLLGEGEVAFARRDFVTARDKAEQALAVVAPGQWQSRIDMLVLLGDALGKADRGSEPVEEAYHLAVAHGANHSAATAAWKLAVWQSSQGERDTATLWSKRYEAAAIQAGVNTVGRTEGLACRVLDRQGEYAAALPRCREAAALQGTADGPDPDLLLIVADAYTRLGKLEKALPLQEELYRNSLREHGPNHPQTGGTLMNLGNTYGVLGEFKRKAAASAQARKVFEQVYGPKSRWVVSAVMNEATALGDLGLHEEAQAKFEELLPLLESVAPIQKARVLTNYATLKMDKAEPGEALDLLAQVEAIEATELPPQSSQSGYTHASKSYALCGLQRWREALSEATAAVEIRKRTGEVGEMAQGMGARILAYRHLSEFEKAAQDVKTQVEVFDTHDLKPHLPIALLNATVIALDQRDLDLAERHLTKATQHLDELDDRESEHAMVDFLRARIDYARGNDRGDAIERAAAAFEQIEPHTLRAYPRTDAKAWLDGVQ